jgi:glycosyltransferase involved in cell wall biosynthesis
MVSTVHSANDVRIVVKEASILAEHGFQVIVIAQPPKLESLFDNLSFDLLPIAKLPRWKRPWKAGRAVMKAIAKHQPDAVHFHDPEFIPFGLALKRKGIKVVYDVHEDTPADILSKAWIPLFLRPYVAQLILKIEHFAAQKFDACITATEYIENRFHPYATKALTLRNYASLKELKFEPTQKLKNPQAVYVGRISFDRGLREMSEACKQLNLTCVLAGPIGPVETEWLKEQPHIEWRGILGRHQIAELLNNSLVGLCVLHPQPNYLHALPIKLFEYMASGLPVIVSDLPVSKKIVEQHQCGFVISAQDTAALVGALQTLLNQPEQARAMGENGKNAVFKHYHWEAEGQRLIEFYQNMHLSLPRCF